MRRRLDGIRMSFPFSLCFSAPIGSQRDARCGRRVRRCSAAGPHWKFTRPATWELSNSRSTHAFLICTILDSGIK